MFQSYTFHSTKLVLLGVLGSGEIDITQLVDGQCDFMKLSCTSLPVSCFSKACANAFLSMQDRRTITTCN